MRWLRAICLLLSLVLPVRAAVVEQDVLLRKAQSAIGQSLPDLHFTDTAGKQVRLAQLRGKPLIVSMVYTGCADICPLIIENLYPAIELAQSTLGHDAFSVITVGFDTRNDTPDRMRTFARAHGAELPNWQFLSANAQTVNKLSEAIGFEIIPSAGGFGHAAQVTIVDRKGRIYRHVYGGAFSPQMIVDPLLDIIYGQTSPVTSLAGIADRVKLFCTVYNPNTGRYYFNYSLFIGIAIGLVCLLLVFAWLVREFRRPQAAGE